MTKFKFASLALVITSVLALSACDTSIDVDPDHGHDHGHDHDHDHDHGHDHDHDHDHGSATGRLVILNGAGDTAVVYDLEESSSLDSFDLGFTSAVYASPGQRYALLVQRDQGAVRFLDSGFETEAHGDHSHFHTNAPELLSFSLTGERPTHYDYYLNRGAVFYDGSSGIASSIDVISDHSISEERVVASLELDINMHGAAEVRGDHLFTTFREASSEGTLPEFVEVYSRHDDHYDFVQRFETPCPGLHGSAINEHSVAFGCTDGILLITEDEHEHSHSHDHDHADFEAIKVANFDGLAGRVGSVWAHQAHNIFIGRAGNDLVLVDADAAEPAMVALDWRTEDSDAAIVSVAFNYSGNRFAILDDTGHLTVVRLRPDADHADYPYAIQSHFEVLEHLHDGGAAMTVSAVNHQAYISDAEHNAIVVVDLHDGEVLATHELDFAPGGLIWLGFTEEDTGHSH